MYHLPLVVPAPPIVVSSFTGQKVGSTNVLILKTESELKSPMFDIERSTDSTSFLSIGTLAAKGTSTVQTTYTFTDNTPVVGYNFYRLKMVNTDTKFTYSLVIKPDNRKGTVPIDPPPVVPPTPSVAFGIYPNPVTSTLTVQLLESKNGEINIFSCNNVLIKTYTVSSVSNKQELDVSHLSRGMYILQYMTIDDTRTLKFIKF